MKKKLLHSFLLIGLMLCCYTSLMATHIIGGEINYRCLGNQNFEMTLQLFRDCDTGDPWFDDPAHILIKNAQGLTVDTLKMRLRNNDTLRYPPYPCSNIPQTQCIHTTTYRDTIFLPYQIGGYQFVYQICCRNIDIINIINPTSTQAAYHSVMSTTALLSCNNAAVFADWPVFYICNGEPLNIDHSATDLDGDSIAYSLYTPYNNFPSLINWKSPYNINGMLGQTTPFTINATTGLITGTPTISGTFLVGICANEYRNGILISRTRRDFQFTVVACLSSINADFSYNPPPCNTNLQVSFNNTSYTTMGGYLWDFGDGTPRTSTQNPLHFYADTGTYTIMLVAGAGTPCIDTVFKDISLSISGAAITILPPAVVCNSNRVLLVAQNVYEGYNNITSYLWSPAANVISGQGTDSVWMAVGGVSFGVIVVVENDSGCTDTEQLAQLNTAIDIVQARFDTLIFGCNTNLTIPFLNQSTASNNQFYWMFDTLATSTAVHPTYTFPDSGHYKIGLIAGIGQICQDTLYKDIYIPFSGLKILVSDTFQTCKHDTILLVAKNIFASLPDSTNYYWTPTANIIQGQNTDSVWVLSNSNLTIQVVGTNTNNCKDTTYSWIDVTTITPVLDILAQPTSIYKGQSAQLLATNNWDYNYYWTADTTLSNEQIYNPFAKPDSTTTYYLRVQNSFGCFITDSVIVQIKPNVCDNPLVFVPNAFTPNGDGHNDVLYVNGNEILEMTMAIYNRWGQKIFETNDQNIGWDGRFQGQDLPPDVYGYYMKCRCKEGGLLLLKGNITLLK